MCDRRVFVSGYAKLPQGISASEISKILGVGLVVKASTGEIVDVDSTLITRTGKEFLENLLVGLNIMEFDRIVEELEYSYYGHARKALITALKMCTIRYQDFLRERLQNDEG